MADRREREEESGRKSGAKSRNRLVIPGRRQKKNQVNLTDAESRIMPVSCGGLERAFNAQAAVDMKTMLIVTRAGTRNGCAG